MTPDVGGESLDQAFRRARELEVSLTVARKYLT